MMHPETYLIEHWCQEDEGASLKYSVEQTELFRIVLSAADACRSAKPLRCLLEVIRDYHPPSDTLIMIDLRPTIPVILRLSSDDPKYVIEVDGHLYSLTNDAFRTICKWLKDITIAFRVNRGVIVQS